MLSAASDGLDASAFQSSTELKISNLKTDNQGVKVLPQLKMRPQTPRTHRTGGRRFLVRLSSELKVLKVLKCWKVCGGIMSDIKQAESAETVRACRDIKRRAESVTTTKSASEY